MPNANRDAAKEWMVNVGWLSGLRGEPLGGIQGNLRGMPTGIFSFQDIAGPKKTVQKPGKGGIGGVGPLAFPWEMEGLLGWNGGI